MQVYKPGSVPPAKAGESYHLSSPDVTIRIHRSTHFAGMTMSELPIFFTKSKTYLIFQPVRFAMLLMSPSGR